MEYPRIPISPVQFVTTNTSLIRLQSLPPLALYIHFPWCEKKCPYCDFNSHAINTSGAPFDEDAYLAALCQDLEASLPLVWGRRIHSIFIGGGTPSLLSESGMDRLLSDVRARIGMDADIEITMEANPGSVEAKKFATFAKSGINRISLGIQSFNDSHLQTLGRIHTSQQAKEAIAIATSVVERVNLDLMYALPHQTLEEALTDVETAIAFQTGHLSLYHLTIEPNTLFASNPPKIPDPDSASDLQDALLDQLRSAGFERYEVSAFAKKGQRCFHNLNYWTFGDYLGIGAGAHGKISFPDKILRTVKERHPVTYMQSVWGSSHGVIQERSLSTEELPFEFMLNALRLIEGVPSATFFERTGLDVFQIRKEITMAINKQLMDPDPSHLKATERGMNFLNDLQEIFLQSPAE